MALPPDQNDAFLREVDENLKRDEMRDRAKKYGPLMGGVAFAIIAASGAYFYWQDRQQTAAAAQTEQLTAVIEDIGAGRVTSAPGKLDTLATADADGVAVSAKLTRAALALRSGDRKTALSVYNSIATDKGLAQPYRDVALIRATLIDYDSLNPAEVITRMKPLAEPGNPFFGTAGELTGMALMAQGKTKEAGSLFARIAADPNVPQSLRSRAVQVAGSLGVDASGSLPGSLLPAPTQ